jgi:hypothetical protein
MADNTVLNSGSGGDTIATDDIGGVKHQRVKVEYGTDGVATDVNASTPLPVVPQTEVAGVGVGAAADAEASGNGSIIAVLKRLRTLIAAGLPASLVGGRLDVNVGNTPTVNIVPPTSGGCSDFHLVSAATTNANNVKASAGQLYGAVIFNNSAAVVYVKMHNNAGTPTAGAGVVKTFAVQAGLPLVWANPHGMAFSTGIALTIVAGIADNDTTAVGANDCVVDLEYK